MARNSGWSQGARAALLSLPAAVALIAFVVRLVPVLTGGGLGGYGRYDDGVYYTASDAISFGHAPYRDFVLLHPPGLPLFLLPFALLGRAVGDGVGMGVARVVFMCIGAANAGMVARLGSRWSTRAGLLAGLLYACLGPAVYSEQTTLLEPLGGAALLIALLLLLRTQQPPGRKHEVLAGVLLGLSVAVKIWYVATWGFVIAWQLAARRPRAAARVLVAGALAAATVLLPFFALAPTRMFDMVVRDQLSRTPGHVGLLARLSNIAGIETFGATGGLRIALALIAGVVFAVAVGGCLRAANGQVVLSLLALTVLVLLQSPPFFAHYAALTAAPVALTFGIGVDRAIRGIPSRPAVTVGLVAALGVPAVDGAWAISLDAGTAFPAALGSVVPSGCVISDDPIALVELDRLSSDFRQGCRVPVDITGITYDTLHRDVHRGRNQAYQRWVYRLLTSGESFVLARMSGDGYSAGTRRRLDAHPVIAESGGVVLRETCELCPPVPAP